jgi:hypothetical protein
MLRMGRPVTAPAGSGGVTGAVDHSAGTSPAIVGDRHVLDLLMLILLLFAFAGATHYISVCLNLTRPAQPSERDAK